MRRAITAFLMLLAASLFALPASAAERVALIIGNSKYEHAPYLPNPANDAHDIAAAFDRLGFATRLVTDANFDTMRRALLDFAPQAQDADIAVVFFAGHGMEIHDENWLVPVDAEIKVGTATGQEAISLAGIMPIVGSARKLGLVMLDACRDNPFGDVLQASGRSIGSRGLAAVEPPNSVLVMFAAKHGTTAEDGAGHNSPFSTALLHNLEMPGLEINYLFRNVHDEVSSATNGRQEPFVYGTLSKEPIYLKPAIDTATAPAPAATAISEAGQAWASIKDTTDPSVLQAFIKSFASSFYATLASNRLRELSASVDEAKAIAAAPSTTVIKAVATQTSDDAASVRDDTASRLTGTWTWHARCGLVGNFDGVLTMSESGPGQLRFDPADGWSAGIGQIHGNAVSFRRSKGNDVQHLALQLSTSSNGRLHLAGGLTDANVPLGSCPWYATHD